MEAAGLVIGAAGLAGLFSSCVECFSLINSGCSHGRDLEILITKLDVEKTRLLQWGDAVGLLASDPKVRNPLLDADHMRPVIERVLNCIVMLLTDGDKLRSKYGMSGDNQAKDPNNVIAGEAIVSRSRFASFENDYARFCGRIALQQKTPNFLAKAKWVVRDRQGFSELTRDLRGLINNLGDLVPMPLFLTRRLVKEDMDSVADDLGSLRLIDKACRHRRDEWSDAASTRLQDSKIASDVARRITEWRQDVPTRDELLETSTSQPGGFEASGGANESPSRSVKQPTIQDIHLDFAWSSQGENTPDEKLSFESVDDFPVQDSFQDGFSQVFFNDFNNFVGDWQGGQSINYGIQPPEHGTLHCMKPKNINGIKQGMAQSQGFSLSNLGSKTLPSQSLRGPKKLLLTIHELPLSHIALSNSRARMQGSMSLDNLKPLTDGSVSMGNQTPGFCYGAISSSLNPGILDELSDFLPSTSTAHSISPTLSFEVRCADPARVPSQEASVSLTRSRCSLHDQDKWSLQINPLSSISMF
jgi:Prion-inhibition and propagation